VEAHPVLSGVAVGPFMRHAVREGDVDESEARARQHRRRGVGGAACLDDDPGERVFNSLFKVLFIFPSRYLFAIGLAPIFSFRWNLPPTLRCIPKQRDSKKTCRTYN